MTDADWTDLGQLQWFGTFDCVSHQNIHWRFDGKYLRNELGTYLGKSWKIHEKWDLVHGVGGYWTGLNLPKKGRLENVDFNDDCLFWEYDPVTNLLGYSHDSIPRYLSRYCINKQYVKENQTFEKRDCYRWLLAKPKLTDNANTATVSYTHLTLPTNREV